MRTTSAQRSRRAPVDRMSLAHMKFELRIASVSSHGVALWDVLRSSGPDSVRLEEELIDAVRTGRFSAIVQDIDWGMPAVERVLEQHYVADRWSPAIDENENREREPGRTVTGLRVRPDRIYLRRPPGSSTEAGSDPR